MNASGLDPEPMVQHNPPMHDWRHEWTFLCTESKGCSFEPRPEYDQDWSHYQRTNWSFV